MLSSARRENRDGFSRSRDASVERLTVQRPESRQGRSGAGVFNFNGKKFFGSGPYQKRAGTDSNKVYSPPAKRIEIDNLVAKDIVIAVLGPTGAGKSSFINMILSGREDHAKASATVGHSLESCTGEVSMVRLLDPALESRVVFVDTPGFGHTYRSDTMILSMISDWMKKIYNKDMKLAGILYLHRISDNRVSTTPTPLTNLTIFEKLCGKQALRNVVLATTMWDEVHEQEGTEREQELQQKYWKGMIQGGSKTFRYFRDQQSAWTIVQHFLPPDLVQKRTTPPDTRAGSTVSAHLEGLVGRQQETLQKLEVEMYRHSEEVKALREELTAQQEELRQVLQEVNQL